MATEKWQAEFGANAGAEGSVILHATAVSFAGNAVLLTGRSGAGKSSLALQLMAYGATLVSDDRTRIERQGSDLVATAPDTIRGSIEARGIGILAAEAAEQATVALAVDLDRPETERLPVSREYEVLGVALPLLLRVDAPHFAPAVLQWLRAGRIA